MKHFILFSLNKHYLEQSAGLSTSQNTIKLGTELSGDHESEFRVKKKSPQKSPLGGFMALYN